jgi:hypothetical protein
MAATKKTTVRIRRNPQRQSRATTESNVREVEPKDQRGAKSLTVKNKIKKRSVLPPKKKKNSDEFAMHRTAVLKVKSALVAGFKNFMLQAGRVEYAEKPAGQPGVDSLYMTHLGNKVGVYTYDPVEDGDMKVTFGDITSNIPASEASNFKAGIITTFSNVSVRVREASQCADSTDRVQVNINPAFTVFVTVDGVGHTFVVRHTTIIRK